VNNSKNNIKELLINLLLLIVLILLLALPAYLCYRVFILQDTPTQIEKQQEDIQSQSENPITEEEPEAINETPYEQLTPIIDGQQAYIVIPSEIKDSNPTTLIIYNHGSDTTVTTDMENPFMQDLKAYGVFFTQYNYIFAASNAHGDDMGNESSMRDIENLIEWISKDYSIEDKLHMIGFSRGSLVTMNFSTDNPESIEKIALLAPTVRIEEWNVSRAQKLKGIKINIWHGSNDSIIELSESTKFITLMKSYNIPIELTTLDGKDHYDVDAEYMQDILDFFQSS
jgi:predicted esterase